MPGLDRSTPAEIAEAHARCRAAGEDPKAVVRHDRVDSDGRLWIVEQLRWMDCLDAPGAAPAGGPSPITVRSAPQQFGEL